MLGGRFTHKARTANKDGSSHSDGAIVEQFSRKIREVSVLHDQLLLDVDKVQREIGVALRAVEPVFPICSLQGPRVTHRGLKMAVYAKGDLFISECIRRYGIWEPAETDYILDNLLPGDTLIDIGANIGYYSVIASNIVGPKGKVFSFEPDPLNFSLLEFNLAINRASNSTTSRVAISDNADGGKLFRSSDNLGDHRMHYGQHERGRNAKNVLNIQTQRIKPEMLTEASGNVMVKIDTQGWEGHIILGNLDALSKAHRIIFEWFPHWIRATGRDPLSIIQSLEGIGFTLRVLSEGQRALEDFSEANARRLIPALLEAADEADKTGVASAPLFLDLVAERV
jgi:FkbM family methyltransferase